MLSTTTTASTGLCRPWLAGHRHSALRPAFARSVRTWGLHSQQSRLSMQLPLHTAPRRVPAAPAAATGGGDGGSSGSGGSSKGGSGGSGSSSEDGGMWGAYLRLLDQYPLLVKAITTALLSALGNIICQLLVEKQQEFDWKRFNTFTVLGFFFVAPALHTWFGILNRLVTTAGNQGALLRMAVDQLLYAPVFIASLMSILLMLEGKPDQIQATLKNDWPSAIKANWMLWVPAQFINFRFVPPQQQVLFANMVALVWNVYFSFATRPKEAVA